jgi:hypothetical protein
MLCDSSVKDLVKKSVENAVYINYRRKNYRIFIYPSPLYNKCEISDKFTINSQSARQLRYQYMAMDYRG